MGSLVDAALATQSRGPTCRCCVWLAGLSKADRAEVEGAFGDPRLQHLALFRAIRARWADGPSSDSMTRHRKGDCARAR